jgi:hypothetical protein
MMSDHLK